MDRETRIIESGRSLLRVPYHKDGSHPQHGLDCVNFILLSHANADYPLPIVDQDMRGIDAINDNRLVEFILEHGGVEIEEDAWRATDIVLMTYGEFPHHTGFLTSKEPDGSWHIIHCTAKHGMVVEEPFVGKLRKRLHSVWRSPKV
jgi:hypothetical protein